MYKVLSYMSPAVLVALFLVLADNIAGAQAQLTVVNTPVYVHSGTLRYC